MQPNSRSLLIIAALLALVTSVLLSCQPKTTEPEPWGSSRGTTNLDTLTLGDDLAVTDDLTVGDDLNLTGNNLILDTTYAITYTVPITVTGVLTNVRLLYYQVP
jgi:hypothetical protein